MINLEVENWLIYFVSIKIQYLIMWYFPKISGIMVCCCTWSPLFYIKVSRICRLYWVHAHFARQGMSGAVVKRKLCTYIYTYIVCLTDADTLSISICLFLFFFSCGVFMFSFMKQPIKIDMLLMIQFRTSPTPLHENKGSISPCPSSMEKWSNFKCYRTWHSLKLFRWVKLRRTPKLSDEMFNLIFSNIWVRWVFEAKK